MILRHSEVAEGGRRIQTVEILRPAILAGLRMTTFLTVLPGFYFCSLSFAEDAFRVNTRAWPTRVTVGDEIKLHIQVKRPRGHAFAPLPRDPVLDPFEVKDVKVVSDELGDGRARDVFTLILTVFETGFLSIPSLTIDYRNKDGQFHRVQSQPLPLEVVSVGRRPTDKEDIRPIKGPVSLNTGAVRALAPAGLAAFLAAGLAAKIIARRRKRPVDPETFLPPHERALRELGRLKERDYPGMGKMKEHYSELADILRRYLGRRFEAETLERTTREIAGQLDQKDLGKELIGKIIRLLENSDLVKFAEYVPPLSLAKDMERLFLMIVNATKPAGEEVTKK